MESATFFNLIKCIFYFETWCQIYKFDLLGRDENLRSWRFLVLQF